MTTAAVALALLLRLLFGGDLIAFEDRSGVLEAPGFTYVWPAFDSPDDQPYIWVED